MTMQIQEWLCRIFRHGFRNIGRRRSDRHMELVETLNLGGKRQLLLVVCDGRRILVGAGGDSVHSIVAMTPAAAQGCAPAGMDEGLSGFEVNGEAQSPGPEVRLC